jgi:hypothetical protein
VTEIEKSTTARTLVRLAALELQFPAPAVRLRVQLSPVPSLTVTVPVGVRMSSRGGLTLKLTVTGWPTTRELEESEMIAVVVLAVSTV